MTKESKPEEVELVEELDGCCDDEGELCLPEEEAPAEVPAPADEPKLPVKVVTSYIAEDGDTYASISAKFAPKSMSKHAFAIHLTILNKNKPVVAGAEIKVN